MRWRPWEHVDQIEGHSFFPALIRDGSMAVDGGMNRGRFTAELVDRYGCQVIGVEALPALHAELEAREGVRAIHAALAAEDGTVPLALDDVLVSTLLEPRDPSLTRVVVPSISLRTLVQQSGADTIDLVKLDIEGAEIPVLMTVDAETLDRITQISVEFHDFARPELAADVDAVISRLRDQGFAAYRFSGNRSDMLFVNRARAQTRRRRLTIARYRYLPGALRIARRHLARAGSARPSGARR